MGHILTFDLGTTYFKTCLFDDADHLLTCHRVAPGFVTTAPGRWELPISDFESRLRDSVCAIGRQQCLDRVQAICFASQANTFTLLDSQDRPLLPLISWQDTRAGDQLPWLQAFSTLAEYYATTGVPSLTAEFMVAKLRWLREHEPRITQQARKACGLSDYLTLWLTGTFVAEASLAGLTGLANIHQLEFCPRLLNQAGIPPNWMPPVVRAGTEVGNLRPVVADLLGLPGDCRVFTGCLDQFAGAVGAGNIIPDRVSETTGTVLATVRCTDNFSHVWRAEVFQGPAFRAGLVYQMVFSGVSALLLERYRESLPDHPTFTDLDRLAECVSAGAEGLKLCPRWARGDDRQAMFEGHTAAHGRGHEVRAILEGVSEELHRQLQVLCADRWPTEVRAAGGGARSRLWLDIKSRRLGIPVIPVTCPEPASLGAARLVRMAEGT